MKYAVFVIMIGFNQCNGGTQRSLFTVPVSSEEECFQLAKEYSELPFIIESQCRIQAPER